jgi:hypothetical protein
MHAHAVESRFRSLNIRSEHDNLTAITVAICAALAAIAGAGGAIAATVGPRSAALLGASVVAIGAAMTVHAFGGLYRAKRKVHHLHDRTEVIAVFGGLLAELIGGAAGCALGITALGDVLPYVLLPAAAVSLGSAALLVAPAQHRLSWLATERRSHHDAMAWSAWGLALTGTSAIMLGSLALIESVPELPATAGSMIPLGVAVAFAGAALAARYYTPLDLDDERRQDEYAEGLITLMTARLSASRTGVALYQAAATKLAGKLDAEVIAKLEMFAAKELENVDFLEYQLIGLGADTTQSNLLTDVESEATSGIEHILLESDITDPISVLSALHAADLHDESGWKLLAHVAEEVANEELKHELKNKYGDKAEQGRFIARLLERLTQRVLVGSRLAAPLHA